MRHIRLRQGYGVTSGTYETYEKNLPNSPIQQPQAAANSGGRAAVQFLCYGDFIQ